jgi:hypothetical protein
LAVRSGPGVSYPQFDKLYFRSRVYVIGDRGDWYSIVYPDENTSADCYGLPSNQDRFESFENKPYVGPCKTGWVHKSLVKVIAG